MSNPIDDPRAHDLRGASPDNVQLLHDDFNRAAGDAYHAAQGLRAAQHDHAWKGKAADQFRASIGHFPRQLDAVCNGYWEVGHALKTYEGQLRSLQRRLSQATDALNGAQTDLANARATFRSDHKRFKDDLKPGSGVPMAQKRTDEQTVFADRRRVDQLQGTFDDHGTTVSRILDEFERDRKAAEAAVKDACLYAIQKPTPKGAHAHVGNHVQGVHGGHNGGGHGSGGSGGSSGGGHSGGHNGGDDRASASAKEKINAMIAKANSYLGLGYVYGGGHTGHWGPSGGGLDCSSFVSNVLHAGGFLNAPQTTDTLVSQPGIVNGPGKYVTIYDRPFAGDNSHVIIDINGQFYEEGGGVGTDGSNCHKFTPTQAYLDSFTRKLHPKGL